MRFDSARADRITAVVFLTLGAAMTWGGFVMDRLEIRRIHPASIPGLVPMILGVALMICAVFLYRSAKDPEGPAEEGSWSDFAITAGWSVFYAIGLVGNMPFAVATAIYILGFTGWFIWREGGHRPATAISVLFFSIIMAVGVSVLFRYGFLVRLP